jgi:5-methylcytosine-specific restriction protein A
MEAIILAWNPDRRDGWHYAAAVEQVIETGQFLASWTVPAQEEIRSGAEAWLWLQGRTRCGLLGHGLVVSADPETLDERPGEAHATGPAIMSRRITVAFDALLPPGDEILPGILAEAVPEVGWAAMKHPVMMLDPLLEPKVRDVWREFGPARVSDPTDLVPGSYPTQAASRVQVNRYERNLEAQRICVAHHGASCAACGFSFESAYGGAGAGFIQVHHLVPASQIGSDYQLDPVADLVPLCPNCHAMAHLEVGTPRTVAELRRLMAGAGYLAGQTVAPEELEAQQDARRILEQH